MTDILPIKPGINTDIVLNVDFEKELIHIRRALVYDVVGEKIYLSQMSPQLSKSFIGKKVVVTYLVKGKKNPLRYGFQGIIVEFIGQYKLFSSKEVPAIIIEQTSNTIEYNLRMHFRVIPRGDEDIIMTVHHEKVNVLNISVSGVTISHDSKKSVKIGSSVKGTLSLEGDNFSYKARVLRTWRPKISKKVEDLEFVAMSFSNMDKKLKDSLFRKITQIERERRFKEMFPE